MPLSNRYRPEHPTGENCSFGLDFSAIIPPGVGISTGSLAVMTNTATPADASSEWTIGPVGVQGRAVWAMLSGGVAGSDYQLVWTVNDTAGNTWVRTALILCGNTS